MSNLGKGTVFCLVFYFYGIKEMLQFDKMQHKKVRNFSEPCREIKTS